ncbi:MAG: hypothetical protein Q8P34_06510 [Bacteroidota bacterium]|nr:hypothetical protein [Bacteroidota bacterium]
MENITSSAGLKNAIQRLKFQQVENGQRLEEDFYNVVDSLKPANIFRNAVGNISANPGLIDNILGGALGLVTGYLSKKIAIGGSGNIIKKLLGTILQFGVTSVVAQHPLTIKVIGQFFLQKILRKKEHKTEIS